MNDETAIDHDDKTIAQPLPSRPTKRDLIERGLDALDTSKMQGAGISMEAGGLVFRDMPQVMDFAKGISTAGLPLPPYLRGNPGACLFLTVKAIHWRMDPTAVMEKTFEVNGRVGYESQLVHAVIESRAPLSHRLDCTYGGEGEIRTCTVIGEFNNGDIRKYTTPLFKDIRVKNSPQWKDDPDQQLWYFASRAWARKWCPDVLMGIYTKEELETEPSLRDVSPGLSKRLAGSERSTEGHRDGHAANELAQIAGPGQVIEHSPATVRQALPDAVEKPKGASGRKGSAKRTSDLPNRSATRTKPDKVKKTPATAKQPALAHVAYRPPAPVKKPQPKPDPKTPAEYLAYAKAWINDAETSTDINVRWGAERSLRNQLGVTAEDRVPLDELRAERIAQIEDQ